MILFPDLSDVEAESWNTVKGKLFKNECVIGKREKASSKLPGGNNGKCNNINVFKQPEKEEIKMSELLIFIILLYIYMYI